MLQSSKQHVNYNVLVIKFHRLFTGCPSTDQACVLLLSQTFKSHKARARAYQCTRLHRKQVEVFLESLCAANWVVDFDGVVRAQSVYIPFDYQFH